MSEFQLASDQRDLFPLPLVAFENMMLLDDRISHPMTCGAEFTFAGHLDREKLESAVQRACLRHPLFCATVQQRWGHRRNWIVAPRLPYVRWVGNGTADEYASAAAIDLRTEVGLRIWAQTDATRTRLLFDFHHACSDGAGGLAYIEDMLSLYAASFANCPPRLRKLPPVNFDLLRRRGKFPGGDGLSQERLLAELSNLRETVRFLAQRPQTLSFPTGPRPQLVPCPPPQRLFTHAFDRGLLLTQLRAAAADQGATVNDLLIRSLMLTIRDWNRQQETEQPSDRLRILMPMNLRSRPDLAMPAANRMSYGFITRQIADMTNPQDLLQGISQETSRLRRNRLPHRALSVLSLLHNLPYGLPLLFSPERCLATAVLSNVGDPTRRFRARFPRENGRIVVGNAVLTEFTAITPVRPLTRATFFANTYANRLTIGARLDPTVATATDTTTLLQQFASRVAAAAAGTSQRARAA